MGYGQIFYKEILGLRNMFSFETAKKGSQDSAGRMLHAHNWLCFRSASPSGLIALRILWQALDLCFLFFRFFF